MTRTFHAIFLSAIFATAGILFGLSFDADRRVPFEGGRGYELNLWHWQFAPDTNQIHVYQNGVLQPQLDEPNSTANISLFTGTAPSNLLAVIDDGGRHGDFVTSVAEKVCQCSALRLTTDYSPNNAAQQILDAIAAGARVVDLSWGFVRVYSEPTNFMDVLRTNTSVLFVVAGIDADQSEDASQCWMLIAHLPNVLGVNSFSKGGEKFHSSFGTNVFIGAPGRRVLVSSGGVNYSASGTSFAAPHVAAVAALLMAAHPEDSVADIRERLRQGADKSAPWASLNECGGTLNATRALTYAVRPSLAIRLEEMKQPHGALCGCLPVLKSTPIVGLGCQSPNSKLYIGPPTNQPPVCTNCPPYVPVPMRTLLSVAGPVGSVSVVQSAPEVAGPWSERMTVTNTGWLQEFAITNAGTEFFKL